MANKNPTEISLMKGIAVKLSDDVLLTLGYFVHTEEHARSKSEYIYAGRIDKISDLAAEAEDLASDAKRIQKWTWSCLPKYESVVYDEDDTNARGSRWLKMRIKKAVDWETFLKVIDGWKESKQKYNENAKYVSEDYATADGQASIADLKESREALLALVGQSIIHKCVLKSQV